MKNADITRLIKTERIVTSQQGSWKWQEAYRVSWYEARLTDDGRVLWDSVGQSGKMSQPQIDRDNSLDDVEYGSAHNKPVRRVDAVKCIGERDVKRIENHGWKFN